MGSFLKAVNFITLTNVSPAALSSHVMPGKDVKPKKYVLASIIFISHVFGCL